MNHYIIQLNTVNAFRSYANMCVRFHIAGYVLVRQQKINMYDILDIMEQGPVEKAELYLTISRAEELPALEEYMKEKKLLKENPTELPKIA